MLEQALNENQLIARGPSSGKEQFAIVSSLLNLQSRRVSAEVAEALAVRPGTYQGDGLNSSAIVANRIICLKFLWLNFKGTYWRFQRRSMRQITWNTTASFGVPDLDESCV